MSFVKIAEARAVKKIVALIRKDMEQYPTGSYTHFVLGKLVTKVEEGEWKDIKLPAPGPKKGKKK